LPVKREEMMGFIDIHCHILPGLDDGPEEPEESLEMARMAADDGITQIFATPHIMDGVYDNTTETITGALQALRERLSFDLEILPGADVRVTPEMLVGRDTSHLFPLGSSNYLLVELPTYTLPPNLQNLFFNLKRKGIEPVITHPERHMVLMGSLKKLRELKETGAFVQITAMSITGGFGREVRRSSLAMLEKGLVDFVATDAHDTKRRPPVLSKAYEEVRKRFGDRTADRIFITNPGIVLARSQKGPDESAEKKESQT
jgi:protein-tyrosine phosphatase